MQSDFLVIEVGGEELPSLYADLIRLEVELDEELAAMFRMTLRMARNDDGWDNLDNQDLSVWQSITITAGLEEDNELLLSGYITHIKPNFRAAPEQASLEIWGMDKSVVMDRLEVLKDWPDKSDSNIAEEIFAKYGLDADVEATDTVHQSDVSTIIQRETDMQFLKRLALRNGYECYVQGDTGVFKPPALEDDNQPVLAVHFGSQTTLHNFKLEVDALSPSNIGMFQVDRINKQVISVNVEQGSQTVLGDKGAPDIRSLQTIPTEGIRIGTGQAYVGQNSVSGQAEMESLCQGLYHKSEWFVRASGEVCNTQYDNVLHPRKPVTVKGIGETHSGVYYVNHVTHVFTAGGYTQKVQMKRNGIVLTGDEVFSANAGLSLSF